MRPDSPDYPAILAMAFLVMVVAVLAAAKLTCCVLTRRERRDGQADDGRKNG